MSASARTADRPRWRIIALAALGAAAGLALATPPARATEERRRLRLPHDKLLWTQEWHGDAELAVHAIAEGTRVHRILPTRPHPSLRYSDVKVMQEGVKGAFQAARVEQFLYSPTDPRKPLAIFEVLLCGEVNSGLLLPVQGEIVYLQDQPNKVLAARPRTDLAALLRRMFPEDLFGPMVLQDEHPPTDDVLPGGRVTVSGNITRAGPAHPETVSITGWPAVTPVQIHGKDARLLPDVVERWRIEGLVVPIAEKERR